LELYTIIYCPPSSSLPPSQYDISAVTTITGTAKHWRSLLTLLILYSTSHACHLAFHLSCFSSCVPFLILRPASHASRACHLTVVTNLILLRQRLVPGISLAGPLLLVVLVFTGVDRVHRGAKQVGAHDGSARGRGCNLVADEGHPSEWRAGRGLIMLLS